MLTVGVGNYNPNPSIIAEFSNNVDDLVRNYNDAINLAEILGSPLSSTKKTHLLQTYARTFEQMKWIQDMSSLTTNITPTFNGAPALSVATFESFNNYMNGIYHSTESYKGMDIVDIVRNSVIPSGITVIGLNRWVDATANLIDYAAMPSTTHIYNSGTSVNKLPLDITSSGLIDRLGLVMVQSNSTTLTIYVVQREIAVYLSSLLDDDTADYSAILESIDPSLKLHVDLVNQIYLELTS